MCKETRLRPIPQAWPALQYRQPRPGCRATTDGDGVPMRRSLGTAARLGTPAARIAAVGLVAAACLAGGAAGAQQPATWNDRDVAVLQGLDKITARVWTFEARVGEVVRFGTLDLPVEACRVRPPEEPPDSAAFIEVREIPAAPGDRKSTRLTSSHHCASSMPSS